MMRIITGSAKGIKLLTLEGESTRPTSERAKEAIFSMIRFDIEGRDVLDLFAGSGQMGLEAVSCGASSATLIDNSKNAIAVINKNIEKTRLADKCRAICSDVLDYIRASRGRKKYDIVFIDPPYALHAVPSVLEALVMSDMLKPSSIVICESEEADIFEKVPDLAERFNVIKKARYGIAHFTLLTPAKIDTQ